MIELLVKLGGIIIRVSGVRVPPPLPSPFMTCLCGFASSLRFVSVGHVPSHGSRSALPYCLASIDTRLYRSQAAEWTTKGNRAGI